jgi:hypothetical protein
MNAPGLGLAALLFLELSGCASSPRIRAYELESEGKFVEAAKLHESEAERYRAERILFDTNRELMNASRLYAKANDLAKARELAQSRVDWWNANGGGKITTFGDAVVDTLADTADALAALADVCSKARDDACVASTGERITKLFDSRAVSTAYGRVHTNSSAGDYAASLDKLASAHISAGQQDLALRAKVLALSTGYGLEEFRYSEVIDLAKKAGKLALATELEKRMAVLKKVSFDPGGKSEARGGSAYARKSDNPRIDSQRYADWAERLDRADGGAALAAIARLQSAGAAREADQMEGRLRDDLKAQEAREASRRESEETNKQLLETLRMIQSMQPR